MRSLKSFWVLIIDVLIVFGIIMASNSMLLYWTGMFGGISGIIEGWILVIVAIVTPSKMFPPMMKKRLVTLRNGLNLLVIFCISTFMLVLLNLAMWTGQTPLPNLFVGIRIWIPNTLITILVESLIFWAGMIRVYLSSEQLAIKWRVIGAICGMIPIANLIALAKIITIVGEETDYENARLIVDELRASQELCKTKYPILLVHGVFFRDFKLLNYWGRIPKVLEKNGATIYYGEHHSAASVQKCGEELAAKIKHIVETTGCEKVNVIAHSKGGLDMRYALAKCDVKDCVATLTTINTPHRGCEFADYLLDKIPMKEQQIIASQYNRAFSKLGDEHPDFLEAVNDLTHSACSKFNEEIKDVDGVLYRSVGSKLNKAAGGRFPLNMSYQLVKYFDGANDGLVGEGSFSWGSDYKYLTVHGNRGISHGDMIDLNRENIPEFDVREFYVSLVHDLKDKGY